MAPPKSDNWIRRFIVSDPKRHKKGFTVYKVTSIVSRTSYSVIKHVLHRTNQILFLCVYCNCGDHLCVLCTVFKIRYAVNQTGMLSFET